jgi:hypothetical protein
VLAVILSEANVILSEANVILSEANVILSEAKDLHWARECGSFASLRMTAVSQPPLRPG